MLLATAMPRIGAESSTRARCTKPQPPSKRTISLGELCHQKRAQRAFPGIHEAYSKLKTSHDIFSRRIAAASAVGSTAGAPSTAPSSETNERIITEPSTSNGHSRVDAFPDLELPRVDPSKTNFDVVIAGAGPSGLAVAQRIAYAGFSVAVVDPMPLGPWVNNYGVWVDEFEAMGLDDCFDTVWDRAVVHLDSKERGTRVLRRPYARVDRPKLKRRMLEKCIGAGVLFHESKVEGAAHGDGISTLKCSDALTLRSSFVVDATGHSRKLIEYDKPFDPGYQGAYGITVEVESHPFDVDAMLFMDWRDDHLADDEELRKGNEALPTFLYAMPFSSTRIFLEETSLVARPIVPFDVLKRRLEKRMEHLGIKVVATEEEEYCAIPMGGVLPCIPQRVIGIGGTAGMVHPSTGYMVSRVLGAAPIVADAIIDQLCAPADKAIASDAAKAPLDEEEAMRAAEAVWGTMWPSARIRQREFFDFGMEVLLKLDLEETREFFSAFFALSDFHWQGFLSARLSFVELIGFGLALFARSSNAARADLLVKGLPGLVRMLARLAAIGV